MRGKHGHRHGHGHGHFPRRGVRGKLHRQLYVALISVIVVSIPLTVIAMHLLFEPVGPPPHGVRSGGLRLLLVATVLIGTMTVLTYPLARRIVWRLEQLERGVERFGQGELSSRVDVMGHDEIADLARAFNRAADRIDGLVAQQKRMLASASHELRAPLSRLRMALELLLDPDTQPNAERRAELLETCSRDIEELDALVGDVLLAARLENPELPRHFTPLDLAELVRDEATCVGADLDGELATPEGQGDARLLRHMLRNLLDNARKHGGARITVGLERHDGGVRLHGSDDGSGVPEADRARIFEPFYRPQGHSEGLDGGVGLGLSLVRQVAELHGGDARCLPREGGGTRFQVTLPGFT